MLIQIQGDILKLAALLSPKRPTPTEVQSIMIFKNVINVALMHSAEPCCRFASNEMTPKREAVCVCDGWGGGENMHVSTGVRVSERDLWHFKVVVLSYPLPFSPCGALSEPAQ